METDLKYEHQKGECFRNGRAHSSRNSGKVVFKKSNLKCYLFVTVFWGLRLIVGWFVVWVVSWLVGFLSQVSLHSPDCPGSTGFVDHAVLKLTEI